MSEIKEVFTALKETMERGEDAILCTVLSASGSVPRRSGSRMLALADGRCVGTVGGGYGEALTQQRAADMFRTGKRFDTQEVELGFGKKNSVGICGGNFRVILQRFAASEPAGSRLADAVLTSVAENKACWLITRLPEGQESAAAVYAEPDGFLGEPVCDPARLSGLLTRTAAYAEGEEPLYAEPLCDGSFVYIFGGGHVSREVVRTLSYVDFRTVVYENRPEFALPERFPDAQRVVLGEYEEIRSHLTITERDLCLIMTRGDGDYACMKELLGTPAGHIGCIGSRKKIAFLKAELKKDGFSEEEIARIHNPIGLPIGSDTPAEIAVSVAAELIALRAQKRDA